ncbi:MAG TPA: ATP-binding protein [Burkholderiaceae bacterium]|nr:ATP-binding protein [Burkholderiaceae bacterium]
MIPASPTQPSSLPLEQLSPSSRTRIPDAHADAAFTLDERELAERRARSKRRLHTVQIPAIRAIGFVVLCTMVLLQEPAGARFGHEARLLLALDLIYPLLSWIALRLCFGRTGPIDLGLVFLHLDILAWLPNLGRLETSNLFFGYLLLVRVADQTGFGMRRALYFDNVVTVAYLGWSALASAHGSPVATWSQRLTIAATIYLIGIYLSLTGAVTEQLRGRTRRAVRTARQLVAELQHETKQLEAQAVELEHARRAAEEASRIKSQFLAVMSHEIRTPMNGILGTIELLLLTHLSQNQQQLAKLAQQSARSLLGLMEDLLDLSRIEAGRLRLQPVMFDLRALLEEVVELTRVTAGQNQITVSAHLPATLPRSVHADPMRLRQLLLNLLHNAVKFSPPRTGRAMLEAVVLDSRPGRARVRFEVRDNGIGIPSDQLERIFEAFAQVDSSATRRYGGTGLGLTIVKELVDVMGGHITAESSPGVGSVFRVELEFATEGDINGSL